MFGNWQQVSGLCPDRMGSPRVGIEGRRIDRPQAWTGPLRFVTAHVHRTDPDTVLYAGVRVLLMRHAMLLRRCGQRQWRPVANKKNSINSRRSWPA